VHRSGTGTISPFGITRLRFSIQTGTRSTGPRPREVVEPRLERQERASEAFRWPFGEEDERGALVQRLGHLRHRVGDTRLGAAVDQDGAEDLAADEGAQRRLQPVVERRDGPRPPRAGGAAAPTTGRMKSPLLVWLAK
jgi:hypothetical protein